MESELTRCSLDILGVFRSRGFYDKQLQQDAEMEPGEFDGMDKMKLLRKDHKNNSRKK